MFLRNKALTTSPQSVSRFSKHYGILKKTQASTASYLYFLYVDDIRTLHETHM
jgi:hypothetical protein